MLFRRIVARFSKTKQKLFCYTFLRRLLSFLFYFFLFVFFCSKNVGFDEEMKYSQVFFPVFVDRREYLCEKYWLVIEIWLFTFRWRELKINLNGFRNFENYFILIFTLSFFPVSISWSKFLHEVYYLNSCETKLPLARKFLKFFPHCGWQQRWWLFFIRRWRAK